MDMALNKLKRLICHKNQTTNQQPFKTNYLYQIGMLDSK